MRPEFPKARKGYEPESVDSYMEELERTIDQLQEELASKVTAAESASTQVLEIVSAAESTAERLNNESEENARLTKKKSEQDAENTRQEAERQSEQRISKVNVAADELQTGAEDLGASFVSQMDGVRANLNRLIEDVESIRLTINEEADTVLGEGRVTSAQTRIETTKVIGEDDEALAEGPTNEEEAVRTVVENMARNGSTRDETKQYLTESFEIEDPTEIIEDVYSTHE